MTVAIPKANTENLKKVHILKILTTSHIICFTGSKRVGSIHKEQRDQELSYIIHEITLVAQRLKRLPGMQESWVRSLGWEDPLEEEMATHSSTPLPREFHEQRSWAGYSPWDCKESDTTERLHIIMVTPSVWSPRNRRRTACHPHSQNQTAFQVTQR